MKSRSKELLDRAIAATIAAIEIYNKPDFHFRGEAFSILAINGWELLLKAKWLSKNGNKVRSLYVREPCLKKDGAKSEKLKIKLTRSGNPLTLSPDYLAKKLVEQKDLDQNVWANIKTLLELRNSSIHFYNRSNTFEVRLQEIGTASIKNFSLVVKKWFDRDLGEFNFYLMPLSFVDIPDRSTAIISSKEENNFLNYVKQLEKEADKTNSEYDVTINIEVKCTRSKSKDALNVRVTSDPDAPEVRMTEEQVRERYPWDYKKLTEKCRKRYSNFKIDQKYHGVRRTLLEDKKFGFNRHLDPDNLQSQAKQFYNSNILKELDKCYLKK